MTIVFKYGQTGLSDSLRPSGAFVLVDLSTVIQRVLLFVVCVVSGPYLALQSYLYAVMGQCVYTHVTAILTSIPKHSTCFLGTTFYFILILISQDEAIFFAWISIPSLHRIEVFHQCSKGNFSVALSLCIDSFPPNVHLSHKCSHLLSVSGMTNENISVFGPEMYYMCFKKKYFFKIKKCYFQKVQLVILNVGPYHEGQRNVSYCSV